ncbi:hypothetical protein SUGI_0230500 [Cryptomeria japonica]|uniref:homeobox-leucine zipper protein ATHB-6-like n=1 Tax=Cryptomeria japonica TaxID=3369 RepID=UPI002408A943|nr:homeobox-leucine zipper protein ATHB-6-like [Cryptomeria japonica]GLJ14311.1 hypothetical protein SUGI_0230500 [Cryptomeria japonica]
MQPFCGVECEILDDSAVERREKKRRLSLEQVKCLEKSFEMERKLEAERKNQLAFEVGLSPRQVAVWYQNRRSRWKAQQLEKDYHLLKQRYDALVSEKDKLESEVRRLTNEFQRIKDRLDEDEHSKYNKQIDVIDDVAIMSDELYDDLMVLDDYPASQTVSKFD